MTKHKQTISSRSKRTAKVTRTLAAALNAKSKVRLREKFDIKTIPPSIKKSPLKLRDCLD